MRVLAGFARSEKVLSSRCRGMSEGFEELLNILSIDNARIRIPIQLAAIAANEKLARVSRREFRLSPGLFAIIAESD